MQVKLWASLNRDQPLIGPFELIDAIERDSFLLVGNETPYGVVIDVPKALQDTTNEIDSTQSVVISLHGQTQKHNNPPALEQVEYFPIRTDRLGLIGDLLTGTYSISVTDRLTIEDISGFLPDDAFRLWKTDCNLSRDAADAFEQVKYAIVHRFSKPIDEEPRSNLGVPSVLDLAVACLSLIRPTRRSRAGKVACAVRIDGVFDPHTISTSEFVEVPEVQKLFSIRVKDIGLCRAIFPEFVRMFVTETGSLDADFEPLRMAVQLYEQAYAIHYWKARHILWWAAIESLFGNDEDAVFARVYAFLGNKDIARGSKLSIYEEGDFPSCYPVTQYNDHTLGEVLPLIYKVRNESAHGQRVPDPRFRSFPHPFEGPVSFLDVLAEASTFIIRKSMIEILQRGLRDRFLDRQTREQFWLHEFGLNAKQSKKRLRELGLAAH